MSLRKTAKILGISPTYLSLLLNGKRPWRGNLKERYEELVNTFVNNQETNIPLPKSSEDDFVSEKKLGGAAGTRTLYLFNAIEALSQMSYSPTWPDGRPEGDRRNQVFASGMRRPGPGRPIISRRRSHSIACRPAYGAALWQRLALACDQLAFGPSVGYSITHVSGRRGVPIVLYAAPFSVASPRRRP